MNGKIVIDFERCKGCGLCVPACPNKCIAISKKSNRMGYFPADSTNEGCTGCGICAMMCPDAAIEVYREDKPSSKEGDKS
jgi:2-oxoglutarate ferredoxin oxidoreductase subunit delta